MLQDWEFLTFLHWRYDPVAIQKMLPRALKVDTFDGAAWIGLVPFLITNLRAPPAPALPWISRFPETNVRTYVRGTDGKPAVWFFTLEAARLAAVIGARVSFGLPYRWARMRVVPASGEVHYSSRRVFHTARTDIRIGIGDPIPTGDLEHFLTARYRLYAVRSEKLVSADVEHRPWPLRAARVLHLDETLLAACGLRVAGPPVAHYSPAVHTRVDAPIPAIM